MRIKLNVPEYSVKTEYQYTADVLEEGKQFPILTIGRSSYIVEAVADTVIDEKLLYNLQVGRYCAIAQDVKLIVDLNHDYRRVCQGRIYGIPYQRPELTFRKGELVVMNDCWIGENVTILSGVRIGNGAVVAAGAFVSRDVPAYAIVAGNPAEVIGYRFMPEEIDALRLIRWWNWPEEMIQRHAADLMGDIGKFIHNHFSTAKKELSNIVPVDIKPIPKENRGEEKILLYIPDFEQDYPTYPNVIEEFIRNYSDTNYEMLLYIRGDNQEEKLEILQGIFSKYEEANCYINLYIGNIEDEKALFCQVDGYITNRSVDNVIHIDMADLFDLPIISSTRYPVFNYMHEVQQMVKKGNEVP